MFRTAEMLVLSFPTHLNLDIVHVRVNTEGQIAGQGPGGCGPRHHAEMN